MPSCVSAQNGVTKGPLWERSWDSLWGVSGSPTSDAKSDQRSESCSNTDLPPSWLDWVLQQALCHSTVTTGIPWCGSHQDRCMRRQGITWPACQARNQLGSIQAGHHGCAGTSQAVLVPCMHAASTPVGSVQSRQRKAPR